MARPFKLKKFDNIPSVNTLVPSENINKKI